MKKIHYEEICRYASVKYDTKPQVYSTSTDYKVNVVIHALEGFKLFLINKSEIAIRTNYEAIVAYGSQQINTDKKTQGYNKKKPCKVSYQNIK